MRVKAFFACIMLVLISLAVASCATGVSQQEYDKLASDLAQTEEELERTEATLDEAEATLSATEEVLAQLQAELATIMANPPILELHFVDIGDIAKVTDLKVAKEATEGSTYIVECQLELTGELPELVNVVDVELYVEERFVGTYRWIDISSTGFITTNATITVDTGLEDFVGSIKLKIVPSFKVFGA